MYTCGPHANLDAATQGDLSTFTAALQFFDISKPPGVTASHSECDILTWAGHWHIWWDNLSDHPRGIGRTKDMGTKYNMSFQWTIMSICHLAGFLGVCPFRLALQATQSLCHAKQNSRRSSPRLWEAFSCHNSRPSRVSLQHLTLL